MKIKLYLNDWWQIAQFRARIMYRRVFKGADKYGTIYYKEEGDKWWTREEICQGGYVSFGDHKHILGSYRVWIHKEEVPFEGY